MVGLLLALPLTVTVALSPPTEVGPKKIRTVHLPPGPTWTGVPGCPHEVVPWKSTDPLMVPPLKVIVEPFFFLEALVSVAVLDLMVPILTRPKFTEPGESLTGADTRGVGVGVGVAPPPEV
jgi:hypothetical protein